MQMFTDFVSECRADMIARNVYEEESAKGNVGLNTFESARPITVSA